MDWGTLVATASGGLLAVTGTVLADYLRHHHEDDRGLEERRRALYLDFIAAAGACHTRLREIAQHPATTADRDTDSRAALNDTGIYEARERLYIDATTAVAGAGQSLFEHLRALQRAVAGGAAQDSAAFHEAYHPYLDSVWRYRVAVRRELEGRSLTPAAFGWQSWDGRDRCPSCRERAAEPGLGGGPAG
ncbi:CchlQ [Streptomyces sp. SCSIO ZS0520]|uniref:CchlQ n=1 Tax=Streptomyces sp. SCSIO ZS0520 TaxID=2892996 RepID=UPI0021D8AFC2|nr:CchlQ [Streptomyces sp. SCSIO ZS0520]